MEGFNDPVTRRALGLVLAALVSRPKNALRVVEGFSANEGLLNQFDAAEAGRIIKELRQIGFAILEERPIPSNSVACVMGIPSEGGRR